MKTLFIIVFIISCIGCDLLGNSKLVRKKIQGDDIVIKWYYYSYITSESPDFVTVEKNGDVKEIYQANRTIADINLKGRSIILKLVTTAPDRVFTKKIDPNVFGYKIVIDSTGTDEEALSTPKGIKE